MKPGAVIAGRYRVVRLLGRGGMGEVYEVLDQQVDRPRALKVMHTHAAERAALRERFQLEARLGGRIDSPHLVEVVDTGVDTDTDRLFLVMELLTGENLAERLARLGPRPATEVIEHLAQVATALHRMHVGGVVHRDLKPANLFLHQRGDEPARIKILDLGIAKVLGPSDGATTSVAGTPAYMAPEQLRGRGISAATDQYALGMVAFTLLSGRAYWREAGELDPIAFGLRAAGGPPEPASARSDVRLSPAFDAWFARVSARDPGARFGSAIAAVRALAGALEVEVPAWLPPDPDPSELAAAAAAVEVGAAEPLDAAARSAPMATTMTGTELATPAPPPRRRRARAAVATALGVTTIAGASIAWWARGGAARNPTPPSTLPMLACPVFATRDAEADGWLAAAAASLACERARIALGGVPGTTLAPAELLDLPPRPADGVPDDPYRGAAVREAMVATARARSQRYLDGAIERTAGAFRVALTLRDATGRAIATGQGSAPGLLAAVRAAQAPLLERPPLAAVALDPRVGEFMRARDTATAMAQLDLTLAMAMQNGELDDACAAMAASTSDLRGWTSFDCAFTRGRPAPTMTSPDAATDGGFTARVRVDHMRWQRDDAADAARLMEMYPREPSATARSVIAATVSCAVQTRDAEGALDWAQRAVQDDPRNFVGGWCAPWLQLATLSLETPRASGVLVAWRAWVPWESYAWLLSANHEADPARAIGFAERAYLLSPIDAYVADNLAVLLIRAGRRDDARAIAVAAAGSPEPTRQLVSDLIAVRIDASEARFASAIARAEHGLALSTGEHGWTPVVRLELAWRAVEVARVVGRGTAFADRAVEAFIDPDPMPVSGSHIDVARRLIALCASASHPVAARCGARLAAALPTMGDAVVASTRPFLDGVRAYTQGDLRAAARAWRPLVASGGDHLDEVADAMVRAFAADGDVAMVERLVERSRTRAGELGGATLAMAEGAVAAAARGDRSRAAELARIVLAAWANADSDISIARSLRALTR